MRAPYTKGEVKTSETEKGVKPDGWDTHSVLDNPGYISSDGEQNTPVISGEIEMKQQREINMKSKAHRQYLMGLCKLNRDDQLTVAHAVFWAIFKDKNVVVLKDGNVLSLSHSKAGLRQFRYGKFLYIEQNPRTGSKYAEMAKKGAKIMWVINVEDSNNNYVGRIIDGVGRRLV